VGGPTDQLTPAERRLLALQDHHLTFKEFGELLRISPKHGQDPGDQHIPQAGRHVAGAAQSTVQSSCLVEMPDALGVTGRDRDFMHIG
jgi:hypothetical protein